MTPVSTRNGISAASHGASPKHRAWAKPKWGLHTQKRLSAAYQSSAAETLSTSVCKCAVREATQHHAAMLAAAGSRHRVLSSTAEGAYPDGSL